MKENEVFHHTFCIIIRTIMKLECFQWTNCLLRYLVHTILSYFDLKCNLNYAIHIKTRRKMRIFCEFLLPFFSIFLGRNSKKATHREILHFEKLSSFCNWFGKRTMFLVFAFFHSLCKLRILTSPLSVTKNKKRKKFSTFFF